MASDIITENIHVLLEDTWEADDVVEECFKRKICCEVVSVEDLRAMPTHQFLSSIFLCDTTIIQQHLKIVDKLELVPDTYPAHFRSFFKRRIAKLKRATVEPSDLPIFIKPQANDKEFDGVVISTVEDLAQCGDPESFVYISSVVKFVGHEHRLFIGDGRLYAKGIRCTANDEISTTPSEDHDEGFSAFVDDILNASGGLFCAVDVSLLQSSQLEWAVVEVGDPFKRVFPSFLATILFISFLFGIVMFSKQNCLT